MKSIKCLNIDVNKMCNVKWHQHDAGPFPGTMSISVTKDPDTAHIPVIIVSTKNQTTDKMWGMRQGASEYLTKPVVEADLITALNKVLNK